MEKGIFHTTPNNTPKGSIFPSIFKALKLSESTAVKK